MIIEALYLPQFHRFTENDKWWGEGFTEWVNVNSAKKRHKNHQVLNSPSWGNYDLTNLASIQKQVEHAKDIGVDVFSVYHYWSDGKLLMEKPIEKLLANKDINFKFYFNWGNHSFYNKVHFSNKKLLWQQSYDPSYIHAHVDYLFTAMNDQRYHRINGNPVLNIYDPRNIPNFSDYISIYKDLFLKKYGLDIHLRVTLKDFRDLMFVEENRSMIDSVYEYQPYFANHASFFAHYLYEMQLRFNRDVLKNMTVFSANNIVRKISKGKKKILDLPYGYGVYTGWDTTPRWGSKGILHLGMTRDLFQNQIKSATKKAVDSDFIVVTAWNEWGEGAILEPCDGRPNFTLR